METVQGKSQREEVCDAENLAAERTGVARVKEASSMIPPTQNGILPHWAVLGTEEERGLGGVWMVPIQDTDERTPVQELQKMEAAAEDPVGRSTEGDRKKEEST